MKGTFVKAGNKTFYNLFGKQFQIAEILKFFVIGEIGLHGSKIPKLSISGFLSGIRPE